MQYNLMREAWIPVLYLDGTQRKIGIRQSFEDAAQIQCICDPVFYNRPVPMYTYMIMDLLTKIVASAYFKESVDYIAASGEYIDNLAKSGIYTDVIQQYINQWEDKFDLFGKRPFLQDASLRSKIDARVRPKQMSENFDFVPSANPLAPAANQLMSGYLCEEVQTLADGSQSLLATYQPTAEMYAFAVLFAASLCPRDVQYPAAMAGNSCEWILRNGSNLSETIILNCVPLIKSSSPTPMNPDIKPDAPVWEWDSPTEYREYIQQGTFGDNLLACSYAPIRRLYGVPDENGYIKDAALWRATEIQKAEGNQEDIVKQCQKGYIELHPHAIKRFINVAKQNEPEKFEPIFVTYYPKYDAWAHSVAATACTGKSHQHCAILNQPAPFPYTITMYYRLMHEKKTVMFGCGKIQLSEDTVILLNERCHDAAVKFQNAVERAVYDLEVAISIMQERVMPEKWSKSPTFQASYYPQISKSINDYFYRVFCVAVQDDADSAVCEAIKHVRALTLNYFDRKYQNTSMVSLYTRVRNRLYQRFNFYLTEVPQNDK